MLQAYTGTLVAIFLVELTDRTRLLALLLSARYRTPWQLILGMTLGYVPATLVAVWGAGFITQAIPPSLLKWFIALAFFAFGAYLLWQHADEDGKHPEEKWLGRIEHLGPFLTGFILVAVTEFADKSQIATAGLMIKYQMAWPVFLGSLSAQGILNVIYVLAGQEIGKQVPAQKIRWAAGIIFLLFGVFALLR